MSDADRSLVVVLSRVLGPRGMELYSALMRDTPDDPVALEYDELPADADESTRQDLAQRLVPYLRAIHDAHPDLRESRTDAPGGERFANATIADAMAELYNEAQLDVLRRAGVILRGSAT
jgi:hypothetical protein